MCSVNQTWTLIGRASTIQAMSSMLGESLISYPFIFKKKRLIHVINPTITINYYTRLLNGVGPESLSDSTRWKRSVRLPGQI